VKIIAVRGRPRRQFFRGAHAKENRPDRDAGRPWRTASPSPKSGSNAFEIARQHTDKVVLVNEEQIALAILRIVELEKGVVEGAAATTLAACLSGQLPELAGKRVVLLLCGGNIDPNVLSRVIERGPRGGRATFAFYGNN
jgi:threonine dehydratase